MSACLRSVSTMEDYYDNGVLKYRSETVVYGAQSEFEMYTKSVTYLEKYYENGQLELRQKVIERPAFHTRDATTGEPVNKIPKKIRKYWKYDRAGNLVEFGVDKTRRSKSYTYDVDTYDKVKEKQHQNWRNPKIKYYDKYAPD